MLTKLFLFSGGLYGLHLLGKFRILKHPLGMRKPGTPEGSWTGAYVGCVEHISKPFVSGVFKDNCDYIAYHSTCVPVLLVVLQCWRNGWKPMTREDIHKTAGI